MNEQQIAAVKQALEILHYLEALNSDTQRQKMEAITALRHILADQALDKMAENARELGLDYYVPCCTDQTCAKCVAAKQPKCNPHPKAPHGFDRNASHSADRYVCECESWDAYDAGYQEGYQRGLEAGLE